MVNAGRHGGRPMVSEARAGRYLTQPAGYRASIPAPFPPAPPVRITGQKGHRRFRYDAYIRLFDEPAPTPQEAGT
jgi:hypothetical protein